MKTEQIQVPDGYVLKQVSEGKWELVKSDNDLNEILNKDNFSFIARHLYFNKDLDLNQRFNRFIALSKLQCVADYLNEGWQPSWEESDYKWYIKYINIYGEKKLEVEYTVYISDGQVFFKSKKLAQRAIEICGEQLVKDALGI